MKTKEQRLAILRARVLAGPCGRRAKYVSGCRCVECTQANREYNAKRVREIIRTGETGQLVDVTQARRHIYRLSRLGCGYKQVADAAGVAKSIVAAIRCGRRQQVRKCTADRILNVDPAAAADHALVNASPTWRLIDELLSDGYRKAWLSEWLGNKRSLQIGKEKVTVRTAAKVRKLYDDLRAGRIRRKR